MVESMSLQCCLNALGWGNCKETFDASSSQPCEYGARCGQVTTVILEDVPNLFVGDKS